MICGLENANSINPELQMFSHYHTTLRVMINLFALLLLMISCEDNQQKNLPPKRKMFVTKRIYNATYELKDSGYRSVTLRAPIVEMYEEIDTPFTVFPKGLNLNFYKKGTEKPGFLRASYAKIIELKGWYEAKGNVILINPEGDTMKTQQLFWNKKTRLVYSRDTVRILRIDSSKVTAINGLEANDDFKTFKLFNNKGAAFVKSN